MLFQLLSTAPYVTAAVMVAHASWAHTAVRARRRYLHTDAARFHRRRAGTLYPHLRHSLLTIVAVLGTHPYLAMIPAAAASAIAAAAAVVFWGCLHEGAHVEALLDAWHAGERLGVDATSAFACLIQAVWRGHAARRRARPVAAPLRHATSAKKRRAQRAAIRRDARAVAATVTASAATTASAAAAGPIATAPPAAAAPTAAASPYTAAARSNTDDSDGDNGSDGAPCTAAARSNSDDSDDDDDRDDDDGWDLAMAEDLARMHRGLFLHDANLRTVRQHIATHGPAAFGAQLHTLPDLYDSVTAGNIPRYDASGGYGERYLGYLRILCGKVADAPPMHEPPTLPRQFDAPQGLAP